MKDPSYELAKELFDYHEDGYLIWKSRISNRTVIGSKVGYLTKEKDYLCVSINYKKCKVHRIIFLWHEGYLPELVDHDDQDSLNNKIGNLKDASKQCNQRNRRVQPNNTSGITGVYYNKKRSKWSSQIVVNRKCINLGNHVSREDAIKARYQKEVELNWKGCNSNSSSYIYLKERNLL